MQKNKISFLHKTATLALNPMSIFNYPNNTHKLGDERYCLKYLNRKGNAYLMDNHLAASWCWMMECDEDVDYGFLHIDRHHDMCREGITPRFENLKSISLEDYLSASYTIDSSIGPLVYPAFSWNTYITKCFDLSPRWFSSTALIIKQCLGNEIKNQTPNFLFNIFSYSQALKTIHKCLSDNSRKWIVNVDIDYFFGGNHPDVVGADVTKRYKDSTIRKFGRAINQHIANIQVLTVALSPECCGDLGKSLEAFKVFAEEIPLLHGIMEESFMRQD